MPGCIYSTTPPLSQPPPLLPPPPLQDGYTSISHRGKAVVDYFLTPHNNIADVEYFEVITVNDIVCKLGLVGLGGPRVSDHSILQCKLKLDRHLEEFALTQDNTSMDTGDNTKSATPTNASPSHKYSKPPKGYKKARYPQHFLTTLRHY